MHLKQLQREWQRFGESDPLWAILTAPERKDHRWDETEFFRTGEAEIASALREIEEQGLSLSHRRALDFGCGVGRLTQALALRFEQVDGVDIAPAMIERGRALNRHGQRCSYHVNNRADLELFADGSFDLIYSVITLQHMEPRYAKAYLREFVRVLAPGGVLVVQLPDRATTLRGRLVSEVFPRSLRRLAFRVVHGRAPIMEMYAIRRDVVESTLADAGAEVRHVRLDHNGGRDWPGYRYFAVRAGTGHRSA